MPGLPIPPLSFTGGSATAYATGGTINNVFPGGPSWSVVLLVGVVALIGYVVLEKL